MSTQKAANRMISDLRDKLVFDSAQVATKDVPGLAMYEFIRYAAANDAATARLMAATIMCAPVGAKSYVRAGRRTPNLLFIVERQSESDCVVTIRSRTTRAAMTWAAQTGGDPGVAASLYFRKVTPQSFLGTLNNMQRLFTGAASAINNYSDYQQNRPTPFVEAKDMPWLREAGAKGTPERDDFERRLLAPNPPMSFVLI